eukprot:gene29841-36031_t
MLSDPDEELQRILSLPPQEIAQDIHSIVTSVQALVKCADGHRLQGGEVQMAKAEHIYSKIEEIMRSLLAAYQGERWHILESCKCKLGLGVAYSTLKQPESAEVCIRDAVTMLTALTVIDGTAPDRQEKNELELLGLVSRLVKDFYFSFSDPQLGDFVMSARAFHVLEWCSNLTFFAPTGNAVSPLEFDNISIIDKEVGNYFNSFTSSETLVRYATASESMQDAVQNVLDLVLCALSRVRSPTHKYLTIRMCQKLTDAIDVTYALVNTEQLPVFLPIRLLCTRYVLENCMHMHLMLSPQQDPNIAGYLDGAYANLLLLGERGRNRAVAELWGDYMLMRGFALLALCIYAACFTNHSMGVNSHMKRLADKMKKITSSHQVADEFPVPGLDEALPFVPFLRKEKMLLDSSRLAIANLNDAVGQSRVFLNQWDIAAANAASGFSSIGISPSTTPRRPGAKTTSSGVPAPPAARTSSFPTPPMPASQPTTEERKSSIDVDVRSVSDKVPQSSNFPSPTPVNSKHDAFRQGLISWFQEVIPDFSEINAKECADACLLKGCNTPLLLREEILDCKRRGESFVNELLEALLPRARPLQRLLLAVFDGADTPSADGKAGSAPSSSQTKPSSPSGSSSKGGGTEMPTGGSTEKSKASDKPAAKGKGTNATPDILQTCKDRGYCEEFAKNPRGYRPCSPPSTMRQCVGCNQVVCLFHGFCNSVGLVAGHSHCTHYCKKYSANFFARSCSGHMVKNGEDYFCEMHFKESQR